MQTQTLSIQYIHMLKYTIGYINQSYNWATRYRNNVAEFKATGHCDVKMIN